MNDKFLRIKNLRKSALSISFVCHKNINQESPIYYSIYLHRPFFVKDQSL